MIRFKMTGERLNSFGEKRYLHFWRSDITWCLAKLFYEIFTIELSGIDANKGFCVSHASSLQLIVDFSRGAYPTRERLSLDILIVPRESGFESGTTRAGRTILAVARALYELRGCPLYSPKVEFPQV